MKPRPPWQGGAALVGARELLESGLGPALGFRLDQHAAVGKVIKQGVEGGIKGREGVLAASFVRPVVESSRRQLRDRIEPEPFHLLLRALAHGIVGPDDHDPSLLVFQPERLRGTGRENIDHLAAHGALANLVHPFVELVAGPPQICAQNLEVDGVADGKLQPGLSQPLARRHALKEGVGGGDHKARRVAPPGEAAQRGHPPAHHLGGR